MGIILCKLDIQYGTKYNTFYQYISSILIAGLAYFVHLDEVHLKMDPEEILALRLDGGIIAKDDVMSDENATS